METITINGIEYKLTPISKEEVYSDWRLPTIDELKTLVNYSKFDPASDLEDTLSNDDYWSSTTLVSNTSYAWYVNFYYGGDNWYNKTNSSYVRCVRDGENGLEWSASSESTMDWDEAEKYAKSLEAPVYYKEKVFTNMEFTRVEIINKEGRVFANRSNYIISIQDDGETLKLFEKERK